MNSGRPPTPLGGDGIQPFILVPHILCSKLVEELRSKDVTVQVRCGAEDYAYYHEPPSRPFRGGQVDPVNHDDRLTFPGGDAARIEVILNAIEIDPGWYAAAQQAAAADAPQTARG